MVAALAIAANPNNTTQKNASFFIGKSPWKEELLVADLVLHLVAFLASGHPKLRNPPHKTLPPNLNHTW
jgi:hypothetical protein